MKSISSALLILTTVLSGCSTMKSLVGHGVTDFYDGEKRPITDVAIIENNGNSGWGMGSGVIINSIDGKKLALLPQSKHAILPGQHEIDYECDLNPNVMGGNNDPKVGHAKATIDVAPGVHYKLVGQIHNLPSSQWYYTEKSFLGKTDRVLNKHSCELKLMQYKVYSSEV
ncbi:MAG: hypothetical protein ACJA0I_000030 [Gammaproteobacteria bacterium]|jgi:hypothetical protein|uniref:hypothetical protein n=1 Tax=Thalassolituus TaxID=187492 RepID=UPI0009493962|nr:hypothetical protein [Thalassolituus oleivorans]APR68572.1 hypothetical protein CN03_17490 [Thalassolituus oleivorans]MBN59708.1 hypothetical protein [Oceanospirillaceae bacterium]|tara:strand:+ start:561 stop:1070 length:510 start_codon:yes stop_codon:yes gene_type:complete